MIELHNTDALQYLQGDGPSFDLVIADPPYSSGGMVRGDRMVAPAQKYLNSGSGNVDRLPTFAGDTRDQRSYLSWSWLWMSACMARMNQGAILAVFTDWRQLPVTTDAVQAAGFVWRGIVPWYKQASRPQADRYTNACEYIVWATNGARDNRPEEGSRYPEGWYAYRPPVDRIHVTEKPVDLYWHLFGILQDGSFIFDPFLGSGASAEAAHVEGRDLRFVGTEIKRDVYEIAQRRVELARIVSRLPL